MYARVLAASCRSSSARSGLSTFVKSPDCRRRTSAEPTMPRAPATMIASSLRGTFALSLMVLEGLEACAAHQGVATCRVVVGVDHLGDQFGQRRGRGPAQLFLGLGRIAQQRLDL